MASLDRRFVTWIVRNRRLVVLLVLIPTLAGGIVAGKVGYDDTIEDWFLDGDPELDAYNRFTDRFAADQIVVLGIFDDQIFTPPGLRRLASLTEEISDLENVHRARSLTNARVFRASEDAVEVAPLARKVPQTQAAANEFKSWALNNPLLKNSYVSPDGRAAAIVVELDRREANQEKTASLVKRLEAIAERESKAGCKVRLAGKPITSENFDRNTQRDIMFNTPIAIGVLALILFVLFRRPSFVALPLVTVVAAICWMFGLMFVVGVKLTTVSSVLNGLVLAVGVADTIHVLADYRIHRARGLEHEEAIISSATHLLRPCAITTVTTLAGLTSLLVSDLAPIREFAIFSSIGVFSAFVLTFTLVPAILRMTKPVERDLTYPPGSGTTAWILERLAKPRAITRVFVITTSLGLVVASLVFIPKIDVGASMIHFFKESSIVRLDADAIDNSLGGTFALDILITAPDEGMKDPKILQKIEALQSWLSRQPGVTKTNSIIDSLKELNRILRKGCRGCSSLPDSKEAIAQYYLLFEGEDEFRKLVQKNYSLSRVTVRYKQAQEVGDWHKRVESIDAKLRTMFVSPLQARSTGVVKLTAKLENYFVLSLIESFALAFGVITLMIGFLLRSVRLTVYAMIPNLVPIIVGLGFMYMVGISLNPGTLMIAAIAIGLVVDDTVHFLFRYREQLLKGAAVPDAVTNAVTMAGRPIIYTSVALTGSFLVMIFAENVASVHFAVIISVVVVMALVADLWLLPSMLLSTCRHKPPIKPR